MQLAQAIPATISGQPVLILTEGTRQTRGRDAQRSNIMAARVVAETVKSALGPMGMDKMLVDTLGDITITSDGATILKEMDIEHPAAKMMVEVAKTTDDEVGDGTTSVVVLAGRLLEKAEALLDQNVHATIIVDGYQAATAQALQYFTEIAITVAPTDRDMLHKVAMTTVASKMIAANKAHLAQLAVDAVLEVATQRDEAYHVDLDDIKVETKIGASLAETRLIDGVTLDKEVVHAGMPKRIDDARIALLNCPLEIEKTEFTAKLNIENPDEMQAFLDEEERILKELVEQITATGANVVICQKGIDDLVQHFLAKAGILAVRRASSSNIEMLAKATGGKIVVNVEGLSSSDLGYAQLVEERKIGDDDWIFIEGCKNPKAVTLLIRGGTDKVVDEAERSIHDALCVVRDVLHRPLVVAGGGAPEIEVASRLKKWAESLSGKEQLAALGFADALEVIPVTLAQNAGLDSIDVLVSLRAAHEKGARWAGVDTIGGGVHDMAALDVYEPLAVKEQVLNSASEAASMLLRIDDVIASGKTAEAGPPTPPGGPEGEGSEFE